MLLPKTHVLIGVYMAVCTGRVSISASKLLEIASFLAAVIIKHVFVVAAACSTVSNRGGHDSWIHVGVHGFINV